MAFVRGAAVVRVSGVPAERQKRRRTRSQPSQVLAEALSVMRTHIPTSYTNGFMQFTALVRKINGIARAEDVLSLSRIRIIFAPFRYILLRTIELNVQMRLVPRCFVHIT